MQLPRGRGLLALALCLALAAGADDDGVNAANQADEEGEGCAASAEPNDGATVFHDDANPVLFIAVGFCPRAERARSAAGSRLSVAVDLTLEPGGRRFQWNLAHGIDEYGVELELPRSLPDEQYRGTVGLRAPYNVVLPVQFTKLSTGERHLQLVFPVPGFVFGRKSQPWLQVLVSDAQAHARGVREIGYLLQVLRRVRGAHVCDIHMHVGTTAPARVHACAHAHMRCAAHAPRRETRGARRISCLAVRCDLCA